jgi:hypothetical protein
MLSSTLKVSIDRCCRHRYGSAELGKLLGCPALLKEFSYIHWLGSVWLRLMYNPVRNFSTDRLKLSSRKNAKGAY